MLGRLFAAELFQGFSVCYILCQSRSPFVSNQIRNGWLEIICREILQRCAETPQIAQKGACVLRRLKNPNVDVHCCARIAVGGKCQAPTSRKLAFSSAKASNMSLWFSFGIHACAQGDSFPRQRPDESNPLRRSAGNEIVVPLV